MIRSIMVLFVLSALSCGQSDQYIKPKNTKKARFIHNVYFYFQDSVDIDLAADFEAGLDTLSTIPSILKVQYGPPAMTPREVVDNNYSYAYLVEFASKEDHDIYQDHPIHLSFIEKYKSLWKEVKVYDNLITK